MISKTNCATPESTELEQKSKAYSPTQASLKETDDVEKTIVIQENVLDDVYIVDPVVEKRCVHCETQ